MVRPLSNDLRKRAVAAVAKGESCRSVALRFGVAVSSVVKWSQRYRATGSVVPGKMGGHRKPVLEPHRAFIKERISQTPHLTLHALKDELAARGVKVSHNAVWLFLRREGLRFKKTLLALERARSGTPPQVAPVESCLVLVLMFRSERSRTSSLTPPSSRYRRKMDRTSSASSSTMTILPSLIS
jgi:transposase